MNNERIVEAIKLWRERMIVNLESLKKEGFTQGNMTVDELIEKLRTAPIE